MREDPLHLCERVIEGRYRVDAFVAAGGFGYVYKGHHLQLKRDVAIKVMRVDEAPDEAAREALEAQFRAEAETIARLTHPAVVPVLDFGVSRMPDGAAAPWMVLEWVNGRTLADDLDARSRMAPRSPAEVLALVRPVLLALAKAHAMGVAHRDIKPQNLMLVARDLAREGSSDEAPMKVLDFGISKVLLSDERRPASGETETRSTSLVYTPQYATPEQVTATRTGPWTDVHQIALVITEMLTQRPPYDADDLMAIRLKAVSHERPTPARFDVDVGAWEPVLAKALALRPSDRYANARELLDALVENLPSRDRGPASHIARAPMGLATTERVAPRAPVDETEETTRRPEDDDVEAPAPGGRKVTTRIAWAVAALALVLVGLFAFTHAR